MKLSVINTGYFKLDGGAMFGVVPKKLWSKTNPADQNNLCTWAMRSLLIEQDNRLILIDTGIGNKQNDKFFSHYHLHGEDSLENSIHKAGYSLDEITDVFSDGPGVNIANLVSTLSKIAPTYSRKWRDIKF